MDEEIPIRIIDTADASQKQVSPDTAPVTEAVPPVANQEQVTAREPSVAKLADERYEGSLEEWRDRALRLQAEIENFRKRQRRLAEEQILADRERLLSALLTIVDDLERALSAGTTEAESLREGVTLTHRSLMQLLRQEEVEPIQAEGELFDPNWHEAVGTIPHERAGADPNTVVRVVQEGYRLGRRLLRPSRVVIAA
jgi:molecular chaperone GrpE